MVTTFRDLDELDGFPLRRNSQFAFKQNPFKGPSRVVRLCILGVILPSLLIAVPLYLRYRVYSHQLYPLAISDMRIIDGKISTTWCQRQLVTANTTFNAYLLSEAPKIAERLEPLSMVRHLLLEDDMKEYWGFYLLKGSVVKVSTCVRWPGASMIVIRGHKHLHECAYIGDNSSEEAEEAAELRPDSPANKPDEMRRHRPDVQFLQPDYYANRSLIPHPPGGVDEDASDSEVNIKEILVNLQNKTRSIKKNKDVNKRHGRRNSTIDATELKNFQISPPHQSDSTEVLEEILSKLEKLGSKSESVLERLNEKLKQSNPELIDKIRKKRELIFKSAELSEGTDENDNVAKEEDFKPDGIAEHRGTLREDKTNDMSNSEFWSSFSSSEEALLSCAGLILNLPLTPHHKCSSGLSHEEAEETYLMNTIIYKVPVNGYYFFVFNSENEVQQNYLRVKFDLEKAVYDVSESLDVCSNASTSCALNLRFFSSQKVVLELPMTNKTDNMRDSNEFVAISECEPRSAVYALCVIAVPVVFILFAFT